MGTLPCTSSERKSADRSSSPRQGSAMKHYKRPTPIRPSSRNQLDSSTSNFPKVSPKIRRYFSKISSPLCSTWSTTSHSGTTKQLGNELGRSSRAEHSPVTLKRSTESRTSSCQENRFLQDGQISSRASMSSTLLSQSMEHYDVGNNLLDRLAPEKSLGKYLTEEGKEMLRKANLRTQDGVLDDRKSISTIKKELHHMYNPSQIALEKSLAVNEIIQKS